LLDWLFDDGEQQQQAQSQLPSHLQLLQNGASGSQAESQASEATSSSSSSSTSFATLAQDTPGGPAPSDDADKQQLPFTIQKRHLTDASFWCSYAPAVQHQRQWQQLLQRGATAAQLQYANMLANALDKAAAEDGSDYDLAAPGAPVVDAGADAAAGGLFWP
jgi:hypothetical protein